MKKGMGQQASGTGEKEKKNPPSLPKPIAQTPTPEQGGPKGPEPTQVTFELE